MKQRRGAEPDALRLNIRCDLSEILLTPGESELLVGTLTFRHSGAQRPSEMSADDVQLQALAGSCDRLTREVECSDRSHDP